MIRTVVVRDLPLRFIVVNEHTTWWLDELDAGRWGNEVFDLLDEYQPRRFLDAGAWTGIFSIYTYLKHSTVAHAFEPDPIAYAMLCTNLKLNDAARTHAYEFALTGSDDRVTFLSFPDVAASSMTRVADDGGLRVYTWPVDQLHEPYDFAKFDIEGAEADVWPAFKACYPNTPAHISWHYHEAGERWPNDPDLIEQPTKDWSHPSYLYLGAKK